MITYEYLINDSGIYSLDLDRHYDLNDHLDMELLAEEIGEDYHSNHDGWESRYPINVTIINNGKKIATFSVDREYEPVFSASKIEQLEQEDAI